VQVADLRDGAVFAAGVGGVVLVLWLASIGLIRAIRRWFPSRLPYLTRQGLANLFRPSNQTVAVVLALGFGAFLLSTLFLVQHNLRRGLELTGGLRRPTLLLLDIQTDQAPAVAAELRSRKLPEYGLVPPVPMRIVSVKGRSVQQLLADTARDGSGEPVNAWALRREYRSTYRDTLVASERLVAGRWWAAGYSSDNAGPVAISVEEDLAKE